MAAKQSVWQAMNYTPPKGGCSYNTSIFSTCPCKRFMLHPVKAATSFECDGCSHHASYHALENPTEDLVLKKWTEAAAENGSIRKKRRIASIAAAAEPASRASRAIELPDDAAGVEHNTDGQEATAQGSKHSRSKRL